MMLHLRRRTVVLMFLGLLAFGTQPAYSAEPNKAALFTAASSHQYQLVCRAFYNSCLSQGCGLIHRIRCRRMYNRYARRCPTSTTQACHWLGDYAYDVCCHAGHCHSRCDALRAAFIAICTGHRIFSISRRSNELCEQCYENWMNCNMACDPNDMTCTQKCLKTFNECHLKHCLAKKKKGPKGKGTKEKEKAKKKVKKSAGAC